MTQRSAGDANASSGGGTGSSKARGRQRLGAGKSAAHKKAAGQSPESSQPTAAQPGATSAAGVATLTEEEQIESAKYLPRELPPRLFEEERFLFPETYGVSRLRLLVKDPQWLFAHWDVDPASLVELRGSLGERAAALSSLTLRISDPDNGGTSVILLPQGARSWYVRTDSKHRSYRAELGLTLPSGEFRRLAVSNTVVTPRVGPSPQKATRAVSYRQAAAVSVEVAAEAGPAESRPASGEPGPWSAPPQHGGEPMPGPAAEAPRGEAARERGGASDVYRR